MGHDDDSPVMPLRQRICQGFHQDAVEIAPGIRRTARATEAAPASGVKVVEAGLINLIDVSEVGDSNSDKSTGEESSMPRSSSRLAIRSRKARARLLRHLESLVRKTCSLKDIDGRLVQACLFLIKAAFPIVRGNELLPAGFDDIQRPADTRERGFSPPNLLAKHI